MVGECLRAIKSHCTNCVVGDIPPPAGTGPPSCVYVRVVGNARESERDNARTTRRQMRGVEGASDRRKRKADHNSVRRPAIRFVIVLSSRLARRYPGERDGSVHAVTRSVLVQLSLRALCGSGVRVLRDSLILHALSLRESALL